MIVVIVSKRVKKKVEQIKNCATLCSFKGGGGGGDEHKVAQILIRLYLAMLKY